MCSFAGGQPRRKSSNPVFQRRKNGLASWKIKFCVVFTFRDVRRRRRCCCHFQSDFGEVTAQIARIKTNINSVFTSPAEICVRTFQRKKKSLRRRLRPVIISESFACYSRVQNPEQNSNDDDWLLPVLFKSAPEYKKKIQIVIASSGAKIKENKAETVNQKC